MSGSLLVLVDPTFALVVPAGALAVAVGLLLLYRMIMRPSQDPVPGPDDTVIILDGANEMEVAVIRSGTPMSTRPVVFSVSMTGNPL